MIHSVSSTLPTFKSFYLKPGLNIVVAEKAEQSSSRDTRNGAGKSSFVDVIHFVFGGTADQESLFRLPELAPHFFSVEFDLAGVLVKASRRGAEAGRVYLESEEALLGRFSDLQVDQETEQLYIAHTKWRDLLGNIFFSLKTETAHSAKKYRPSFRSLFSYFVRRHDDGGFHEAQKHYRNQAVVDYQVNLSYLFHLDWTIAQEWQQVRDQEKSLDALRAALRQGALETDLLESSGRLRTQLTLAEKERDDLRDRLGSFQVIDDYNRLETDASELTRQINTIADENASDLLLIRELRETLQREKPPPKRDLQRVYAQVGVELPGFVVERFEAVREFHESVVRNRRTFLEGEIDAAEIRVGARNVRQKTLDRRRAELMRILQSSGALQQFSELQAELSRLEAVVQELRRKYEMARQLEGAKSDLAIKRARLAGRLRQDLDERSHIVDTSIITFEVISQELYENPGSLSIEATDNGPEFRTDIQGKRSVGKNSMQIFCFDMTLATLNIGNRMPGFLVHDSHLFDGADERQVAGALASAARRSEEFGFQYLVTMNTDKLPSAAESPEGFEVGRFINPVRLTDATEDGGLFGFRFG